MEDFLPERIFIQQLRHPLLDEKKLKLSVARLDQVHSIVSGNKIFKLKYFLEQALLSGKPIITYGGAYSNHLVATAYACLKLGIPCSGVVRGEKPATLSHSLQQCIKYGMQLKFLPRELYKINASVIPGVDDVICIPEGGYSPMGAMGAADIMPHIADAAPDFICLATGTCTTLAGLARVQSGAMLIAVPALKNMTDTFERINHLNGKDAKNVQVWNEYHFGGYAKHTTQLLDFMNVFYNNFQIPLDFIYTGKMMFAVMDKIKSGWFKPGTHVLCLHTGGLQGNESLPRNALVF